MIEDARRLLAAHGLDPGGPIATGDGGIVNPCLLTPRYAIRFNVRDPELPKFANEAVALGLAAGIVPVPQVVVLDTTRAVVPWDALVTRRMPGRPAADEPSSAIAFGAGARLAELHGVIPPGFGDLLHPRATWAEAWADRAGRAVAAAVRAGELPKDRAGPVLARVRVPPPLAVPALVHGDWHHHNLLCDGERVTAVLDFEWSVAADPVLDLASVEQDWPGAVGRLLEGYASVRPLPADRDARLAFYREVLDLELAVVLVRHMVGRFAWADRELAEVRRRLGYRAGTEEVP